MKFPKRFFIENFQSKIIFKEAKEYLNVPKEIAHHIRVLRLKIGEEIELLDGNGMVCLSQIPFIDSKLDDVPFEILNKKNVEPKKIKNILAVSIIDKNCFDFLVEKVTELDIDEIIPIICDYTQKNELKNIDKLIERWQKISDNSISQCGRLFRCLICKPIELSLFNFNIEHVSFFILEPYQSEFLFKKVLNKTNVFFIGPEGGFSSAELDFLKSKDAQCIKIANNILRTETAGICIASILQNSLT